MNWAQTLITVAKGKTGKRWPDQGTFIVAAIILTFGFYLILPSTKLPGRGCPAAGSVPAAKQR